MSASPRHSVAPGVSSPGSEPTVYLEIPLKQAGLMRQVLVIAFREAWQCSDPSHFGGTGALQRAVSQLRDDIDNQLRQVDRYDER
jgi:hypothetical protein